jgi:hypothetical protein
MPFTWSAKDPDEVYEYTHDWSKRLLVDQGDGVPIDVGDTIVPSTDPDPDKRPKMDVVTGDVVVEQIVQIPDSSKLQYWLTGGTQKTKFTATIWTAQGRKYQESFVLPVKQR